MKKKIISCFAIALFSLNAFAAEESPVANIKVSPDLGKAQCMSQPGKGLHIVWGGVVDRRDSKAVGTLKVRGNDQVEVMLAQDPDATIGEAVKTVLKNCGYSVETKKGAAGIKAVVTLNEFFAGSKKGFFMGETEAKGSMSVRFSGNNMTYDYNMGATKSDKRLKKKNVRQLEEVLSGLLDEIVVQLGESSALTAELKKLGE